MKTETRISPDGIERRVCAEIRAVTNESGMIIEGHAAVFNVNTMIYSWLRESIKENAFQNSFARSDTKLLVNHNPDLIFGRAGNKTLELGEDQTGLFYRNKMQGKAQAEHYWELVHNGTIHQSSFQFTIQDYRFYDVDDTISHMEVTEVGLLIDVSPVVFPAYNQTSVKARSDLKKEEQGINEAFLLEQKRRNTIISFFNPK